MKTKNKSNDIRQRFRKNEANSRRRLNVLLPQGIASMGIEAHCGTDPFSKGKSRIAPFSLIKKSREKPRGIFLCSITNY